MSLNHDSSVNNTTCPQDVKPDTIIVVFPAKVNIFTMPVQEAYLEQIKLYSCYDLTKCFYARLREAFLSASTVGGSEMIVHFSFGSFIDRGTYIHVTDCNVSIIDPTPIWHAGWYTDTCD